MNLFYNYNQSTGAHIIDDGENEIAEIFSEAIGDDEAARLARLFAASETMQSALRSVLEWCDLIEQNYPDMTFTKAVRAAVAEAEGKDAEPVKNYAISGRALGDDEASTLVFNGRTRSAALAAFDVAMRPFDTDPGEVEIFVDAVIESETPLTIT